MDSILYFMLGNFQCVWHIVYCWKCFFVLIRFVLLCSKYGWFWCIGYGIWHLGQQLIVFNGAI